MTWSARSTTALARPLPVLAVAGMLGVPADDRDRFRLWSDQRARLPEPTVGPASTPWRPFSRISVVG